MAAIRGIKLANGVLTIDANRELCLDDQPIGGRTGEAILLNTDGFDGTLNPTVNTVQKFADFIDNGEGVLRKLEHAGDVRVPATGLSHNDSLIYDMNEFKWVVKQPIEEKRYIPAGGALGEYLKWNADGEARWQGLDTDPELTADSDKIIASQKAIKAYTDRKIKETQASEMSYEGGYDVVGNNPRIRPDAMTGTVTADGTNQTIVGVGTDFENELTLGWEMRLGGPGSTSLGVIINIVDATHVELDTVLPAMNDVVFEHMPIKVAKGDTFTITMGGNFLGHKLSEGDMILAETVDPIDVGTKWTAVQRNIEQKASEMSVVPSNGLDSTNVQAALDEHQVDINLINGTDVEVGSVNEKIKTQVLDIFDERTMDVMGASMTTNPAGIAEFTYDDDNNKHIINVRKVDLGYVVADRELTIVGGANQVLPLATTTADGMMSKDDKVKMDGLAITYTQADDKVNLAGVGSAVVTLADATYNGLMSKDDKIKMDGLAITYDDVDNKVKLEGVGEAEIPVATQTEDGLMLADDKQKLDQMADVAGGTNGDILYYNGSATVWTKEFLEDLTFRADITCTQTVKANDFVETSAKKYKENVVNLDSGSELDKVCKTQGVTYNLIGSEDRQYGFIADDLVDVYPEMVDTRDGEVEGFGYSRMVASLVEAVKELKGIVDAQGKKIAELEGK